MEEFKFACPYCHQTIEADESLRGQVGECPCCGENIVVPRKFLRNNTAGYCSPDDSPVREKTILTVQTSPANYFALYILFALSAITSIVIAMCDSRGLSGGVLPAIGIVGCIVSIALIIFIIAVCNTTKYTITNLRVIAESGIISKSTTAVRISDIRAVRMDRGLLQKMFNLASIIIATAATAGAEIIMIGIPEWERVVYVLNTYARSRKGGMSTM